MAARTGAARSIICWCKAAGLLAASSAFWLQHYSIVVLL